MTSATHDAPVHIPKARRGGWLGIVYVCVAPLGVAAAVLVASLGRSIRTRRSSSWWPGILLSGVALYLARRPRA